MMVSAAVMRKALCLLEAGVPFCLCTVIGSRGSVPGRPGAKMIVTAGEPAMGTVGGAGLEEQVKALALRCLEERRTQIAEFDLSRWKPNGLDSLCGGSVQIMIEYMEGRPHVLICGGGHVGLEVGRLCDQLEYAHSVFDERAEFSTKERFPRARAHLSASAADFFSRASLSEYSHLVLLGHSYHVDTEVLARVVERFSGWVGLICSALKRKQMFASLQARGVPENALSRIEAPVGLDIGAETPAEIAVAIMGSVIRSHKQQPAAQSDSDVEEKEAS